MTKEQALNYLKSSGFSKEQIKAVVDALQGPPTKDNSKDELEKQIKQLQNRCFALTHGLLCTFCSYECERRAKTEAEE